MMAERRPMTSKTTEELVRRLPGYKPIPPKVEKKEGEEAPPPPEVPKGREPMLPAFKVNFQPVIKDATDSLRQEQLKEIQSLRDYLARPPANKRDEKDKGIVIPMMKSFERAILLPQEVAYDIKDKKYPEVGSQLMENPFPKKKKKKGGKGKSKSKRKR